MKVVEKEIKRLLGLLPALYITTEFLIEFLHPPSEHSWMTTVKLISTDFSPPRPAEVELIVRLQKLLSLRAKKNQSQVCNQQNH